MTPVSITLDRDELLEIVELVQKLESGGVTITIESQNEIGRVLTASVFYKIDNIFGQFKATITDESDW